LRLPPDADDPDLAQSLDAKRVDVRVRFVDEDHVDVVNICIHGNVVLGDVRVHDPAEAVIHHRLLVQGHPIPQTTPPMIWLRPVLVLRIRPPRRRSRPA